MSLNKKKQFATFIALCLLSGIPVTLYGADERTDVNFRITVLKSTGNPQPGMVLTIYGRSDKFIGDEKGLISFTIKVSDSYAPTAKIFFPEDSKKPVATLNLRKNEPEKTLYIDSREDILALKQQNRTFPIEGIVTDRAGTPIAGATVAIQGTGRKTTTDEIGLFQIDADYNHPISVRANGMENRLLHVNEFLLHPNEAYTVIMAPKSSNIIYSSAEEMPSYPGGMKAFYQYVKRNLVYPPQAKRDSIQGVVVIRFVVEKDGSITNATVARSLEASMDTTALDVVRNMRRWIPANDHGMTVRCKYSVPIQFKINPPKPVVPPADSTLVAKTDSLPSDSLLPDSISLRIAGDSLRIHPLPTDSLRIKGIATDSLHSDSLVIGRDSLHLPAGPLVLSGDSLHWESGSIPNDSLRRQDIQANEPPQKRNFIVRFFRWLFGIKDK